MGSSLFPSGQNSMTALIVAVKGGYTDVVKELLKRNPNVNMTDKDGNTALAIAAKEGHTEIVQDLLDAGTNLQYSVKYLRGAWLISDGSQDQAVKHYSRGYYHEAKRRGMLKETGLRP